MPQHSDTRQNLPAPWLPFLALVPVTRVHFFTPLHLYPNLNPISLFGLILHAHPPTSSTAFHAANFVNLTWLKLADRRLSGRFAEHLCSVSNNDVNQHVARHFNIVNHLYERREGLRPWGKSSNGGRRIFKYFF